MDCPLSNVREEPHQAASPEINKKKLQCIAMHSLPVLALLFAAYVSAENLVLTGDATPFCSPRQVDDFNWLAKNTMAIAAVDPVGDTIGSVSTRKYQTIRKNSATGVIFTDTENPLWFPNDSPKETKQTLCGKLSRFEIFNGDGPEWDWNNIIIPDPDYSNLLISRNPYTGKSVKGNKDCEGGADNCLEAEVTPDQSFYHNPWFDYTLETGRVPVGHGYIESSIPKGKTRLIGSKLCVHGPWVADRGHNFKAEIHPSELMWWRWGNSKYLLWIQDDSNRFDRRSDFDNPPAGWHPWSEVPRKGKFSLAFRLLPTEPPKLFEIRQESARYVHNDTLDANGGTASSIVSNGKVLLTVRELGYPAGNVQIGFENVCRQTDDTFLVYVTLTATVGVDDRGGEGYQLLQVLDKSVIDDVGPPP